MYIVEFDETLYEVRDVLSQYVTSFYTREEAQAFIDNYNNENNQ